MPTAGLSLVGFMVQSDAMQHLRIACVPSGGADDQSILNDWKKAREALGPPMSDAGQAEIGELPSAQKAHAEALFKQPWLQPVLANPRFGPFTAKLVEIEPLLATQATVDLGAATGRFRGLSKPPTMDDLMSICLPLNPPVLDLLTVTHGQSVLVRSRGPNLKIWQAGFANDNFFALRFASDLPFVSVVKFNGRAYLSNGFHRAYGAAMAGVSRIPCLVLDARDEQTLANNANFTFPPSLMASNNAPTMRHFIQGRAHSVRLRSMARILHISWSDYTIYED